MLNACSPAPSANPTEEVPATIVNGKGYEALQIDDVQVEVGVGSPIPVKAIVGLNLPNSCVQLGEIRPHRNGSTFFVRLIAYLSQADFMKHIHPSPYKLSGTDWQTLGELEVRSEYDVERAIQVWLDKTLHPLELHSDLLDRILRSAHEAVTRALHFEDASKRFKHIHLLVFGPRRYETKGQAWGFFRIEKLEGTMGADSSNHAIEFYLYLEGQ